MGCSCQGESNLDKVAFQVSWDDAGVVKRVLFKNSPEGSAAGVIFMMGLRGLGFNGAGAAVVSVGHIAVGTDQTQSPRSASGISRLFCLYHCSYRPLLMTTSSLKLMLSISFLFSCVTKC